MSSVGAIADPTAAAYGVSLPFVGLFTTALVLTHFLVQLPAGRGADRFGALRIGLLAAGLCAAGNALALTAPSPAIALAGRALTGLGSGAGFVAGADAMRAAGLSAVWQGTYGASTMAGGGLAVAIVPQIAGPLGWRAPYWSGLAIAGAIAAVVLTAPTVRAVGHRGAAVVADRRLIPLGIIHAATFGGSYLAASWVVPLLERQQIDRRDAALAGALVLLGGIVTRTLGGVVAVRAPHRARLAVALSLAAGAAAGLLLALPLGLATAAAATLLAGLSAGLPFALLFGAAQRLRPDAPAAALAFVNSWAVLLLLVGTPLAGLAFSLPGEGRIAFAAVGALSLVALVPLRRAAL